MGDIFQDDTSLNRKDIFLAACAANLRLAMITHISAKLQMLNPRTQVPVLCFRPLEFNLQAQFIHGVGVPQGILVTDLAGFIKLKQPMSKVCIPSSRDFFMIFLIS